MIDRADLPSISNILSRLKIPLGRHGRTICPIHRGTNQQAFSYDDRKGLWNCFRCGVGGDAVELVRHAFRTDFIGAVRWLGFEPGPRPAPDPAIVRKRQKETCHWQELIQEERELREEFRLRNFIACHAGERLREDPDSGIAWELLSIAYGGRPLEAIEDELDKLLEIIPREAYPRAEELPGYKLSQLLRETRRCAA